jgi:tRNA dimethylallyltransferase
MVQAEEPVKLEMSSTDRLKAVLICGPTASGKSALALELAREFGGAVINSDSMQVYTELNVITSRPSPQDEDAAPHRLYGIRPMREPYSAALWLADVKAALEEAGQEGWLPIVVGGTGLYFKALTEGLSEIPEIPAAVRAHYRLAAQTKPAGELHDELQRRDPHTAARLRPTDPQRIVRALEVIEATGRSLADWQGRRQPPLLPLSQTRPIVIAMDRGELYRRCDARFETMVCHGAIDEARAIAELSLDPALPAMRAVGLPQLLAHVRGEISLDEAAAAAKQATRHYAKRQLTWISGNFCKWNAYSSQLSERTKRDLKIFIENRLTSAF